jgi:hypothetical protein
MASIHETAEGLHAAGVMDLPMMGYRSAAIVAAQRWTFQRIQEPSFW